MTTRHSNTHWRGALFNALTSTADGIAGFCAWSGHIRNRKIAEITIYKRLNGQYPDERVPIEDAELMTDFVLRDANARQQAFNWIHALAARWGLYVVDLGQAPQGSMKKEIQEILDDGMKLFEQGGQLAGLIRQDTADGVISEKERQELDASIDEMIRILLHSKAVIEHASERSSR